MEGIATDRPEHPVFYAGRFSEQVTDAGLPGDQTVLSDWDVLPSQLSSALERASVLVVLDMLSFPFESLTGDLQDVPLILLLPAGFDANFLMTVFGKAALSKLSFFDRFAAADDVWTEVRQIYGFTEGQRLDIDDDRLGRAAAEIWAALEAESALHAPLGEGAYEADRYWTGGGDAPGGGRAAPRGA